jgi:hypothetical protein
MKRDSLPSFSRSNSAKALALSAFSLTLLAIACGSSRGDGAVDTSSSEIHVTYSCQSTGACEGATTSSACTAIPGCEVGHATCTPVWRGCSEGTDPMTCINLSPDSGVFPCRWVNGACVNSLCTTSPDPTKFECVGVGDACTWTPPPLCVQTTPCPANAKPTACSAANPQCTEVVTGGCETYCGKRCC